MARAGTRRRQHPTTGPKACGYRSLLEAGVRLGASSLLLLASVAVAHGQDYDPQAAARYANTQYVLYFVDHVWTFVILGSLAFTGLGARLWVRMAATAFPGPQGSRLKPLLQRMGYVAVVLVIVAVLCAPVAFVSGYVVEHRFGLSNQSLGQWTVEALKGLGVTVVIATPIIVAAYWLMRKTGRWPLWGMVAAAPLVICYLVVAPVVLDPLFNRFRPYKDAAPIIRLADEQGAHVSEVYVVDRSRQTRKVNAYVTGLFGTTRIVLWDTLIREFEPDEGDFVLAHEIGHYVRHDVWKGAGTAIVVIGLALGFVKLLSRRLVWRFQARLGYDDPRCPASLPLMALLFLVGVFLLTPAYSAVSRQIERQADAFALQATHHPDAAARALQKLGRANLMHPDPPRLIVFWMFDHPPIAERIGAARGTAD